MISTLRPRTRLFCIAVPMLVVSSACSTCGSEPDPVEPDAGQPPADAGAPRDAGPEPSEDAGTVDAGTPPVGDAFVSLQGRLKERKFVAPRPAAGARALVSNASCEDGDNDPAACTIAPAADGTYRVGGLAPGSVLLVNVSQPDESCNFEPGAPPCDASAFSTITTVKTGAVDGETTDLYRVEYQWLLEQAVSCGVAPTLQTAADALNSSATILGAIRSAGNQPLAGVAASRVSIALDGEVVPSARVCFLDDDDRNNDDITDDLYIAAVDDNNQRASASTDTGLFLVFTAGGDALTGGRYTVTVADLGSGGIPLTLGKLGMLTLTDGGADEEAPVDFEAEIMPIFQRNGCVGCHRPGGSGAVPLPGGDDYLLEFTAAAPTVYRSLIGPSPDNSRVNLDNPERSLLIVMPLYEDPPNHPNASFESLDDPDARRIITWIRQGTPRGLLPPPTTNATLTEVMTAAQDLNCTYCHAAERFADFGASVPGSPRGGLALDGCVPFFSYPVEFAPTDGTLPISEQPAAENQRCVYWHLTGQQVATDLYVASQPDNDGNGTAGDAGDGRRVNTNAPDQSLLLRNPYCGPDADGNFVGDGCEDVPEFAEVHPSRLWFSTEDGGYELFRSWVAAGAQNDGTNGAPSVAP